MLLSQDFLDVFSSGARGENGSSSPLGLSRNAYDELPY
jgi:hypothetical protein